MKKPKRIVCITGCRSEYGIVYSVLRRLEEDDDFEPLLVVTGAHLSERFGYTVSEIEADGFRIADRIHNLVDNDGRIGKVRSSSLLMLGLGDTLDRLNPDFVMVAGDREEAIASGVACAYLGVPLIHLCGGDKTFPKEGDVDEPIRHATSKLASLHFTMNEAHGERLLRMGEEPWRVFNSGNPALDRFGEMGAMTKEEVLKYLGFDPGQTALPLILVIQHVISGEADAGWIHARNTFGAVAALRANCVLNYPNSDTGSRNIIRELERFGQRPNIRVTRNIPGKEFVNLLRCVDLLVGNSSMALLEGCFLKIPSINVGARNKDRMNGGNVVYVGTDTAEIRGMAEKILSDETFRRNLKNCSSLYGDGKSAERIVQCLKKLDKSRTELIAKNIAY